MRDYKFKKGDKVRVTGERDHIYDGRVGTVDESYRHYPFVKWDDHLRGDNPDGTNAISENRLELIPEQLTSKILKDKAVAFMSTNSGSMPSKEWFKQHLKPEHQEAALELDYSNGDDLTQYNSLKDALYDRMWYLSSEGEAFWEGIYRELSVNTYHQVEHTATESAESAERMATSEDFLKLDKAVDAAAPPTEPNFGTKSIYVAGKMRGIPYFNFPAFDKARDRLVSEGWKVVSPADIDRESGFDAMSMPLDSDWDSVDGLEGFDLFESFDRDIAAIRKCDSIYMLKGWQTSTGATAEHACAKWLLKEIIYEDEAICEEAYRLQGGDREQDYGSPSKNFEDIAKAWNWYLEAKGSSIIEARDIAHMNILMKVSRNVHKPKRDNWVDMAGYAQCGGKVDEL